MISLWMDGLSSENGYKKVEGLVGVVVDETLRVLLWKADCFG